MNIICLKWGDKFNHVHVNRLYKMICKNYKDDFNFICYTENSSRIDKNIEIRNLDLSYNLEKWWWKLTLFKDVSRNPSIFLDLDVVVQRDMTHFKKYCDEDKICTIKAWWKPHVRNSKPEPPKYNMDLNSSVLIWKGDLTKVWKEFYDSSDYLMLKYNGIDSYLYFHHKDKLNFLPKGEVYSRLYGIDENNYYRDGVLTSPMFKEDSYTICIFNGWKRKIHKVTKKYTLDDDGYEGFEKFWK